MFVVLPLHNLPCDRSDVSDDPWILTFRSRFADDATSACFRQRFDVNAFQTYYRVITLFYPPQWTENTLYLLGYSIAHPRQCKFSQNYTS